MIWYNPFWPGSCTSCRRNRMSDSERKNSLSHLFKIGQVSSLLPSLDVVAVSKAPSPESNPILRYT
ncbi:hypothetical protein DICVIV_12892 [Dictyocaulus viviparus]|uniref:Uncharacterized protein n=1 Tax=Dictyocaulus viviparus TaxID=29172 RepID=A0A0D8XBU4_DICVI|nr:hypothetical protein DICVIV_12892 [Dictyocaulus viviparus]